MDRGAGDGELAPSRTQKGWDLTAPNGDHVQVRYLANPGDRWLNEHVVDFSGELGKNVVLKSVPRTDARPADSVGTPSVPIMQFRVKNSVTDTTSESGRSSGEPDPSPRAIARKPADAPCISDGNSSP